MSTEWEEVKDQAFHHTLKLMQTTNGWNCTYSYADEPIGVFHEKYKTHVELSVDQLRFYVDGEIVCDMEPSSGSAKALKAFQNFTIVLEAKALIDEVHALEESHKGSERVQKVRDAITDKPELRLPEIKSIWNDDYPVWEDTAFFCGPRKKWYEFWK